MKNGQFHPILGVRKSSAAAKFSGHFLRHNRKILKLLLIFKFKFHLLTLSRQTVSKTCRNEMRLCVWAGCAVVLYVDTSVDTSHVRTCHTDLYCDCICKKTLYGEGIYHREKVKNILISKINNLKVIRIFLIKKVFVNQFCYKFTSFDSWKNRSILEIKIHQFFKELQLLWYTQ